MTSTSTSHDLCVLEEYSTTLNVKTYTNGSLREINISKRYSDNGIWENIHLVRFEAEKLYKELQKVFKNIETTENT